MGWNEKYWDIIDRYYWSPGDLGLHAIAKKKWVERKGLVCVPAELVNHSGPLYTRQETPRAVRTRLEHAEEALSDIFDLTFAIAPDAIISRLLFQRAEMYDGGPFKSFGREIAGRFGLSDQDVTRHDGLFVSDSSVLGVELRLATPVTPDTLIRHLALMVLEDNRTRVHESYGVLFIVPHQEEARLWTKLGLDGPRLQDGFLEGALTNVSDLRILELLRENLHHFRSVAKRLRLAMMTWSELHAALDEIVEGLDQSNVGHQTICRLLGGLRDQLEIIPGTAIAKRAPKAAEAVSA